MIAQYEQTREAWKTLLAEGFNTLQNGSLDFLGEDQYLDDLTFQLLRMQEQLPHPYSNS